MPSSSGGTVRLRRAPIQKNKTGWVQELDERNKNVALLKVKQLEDLRQSAGPPWRSEKIPRKEALPRMDQFEIMDPKTIEQLQALSVPEMLQAAFEAIKLRKEGMKAGEWLPPEGSPAWDLLLPENQPVLRGAARQSAETAAAGVGGVAGPKKKAVKVKALPTREEVGGVRVLAGQAMAARKIAPKNPEVPVPVVMSQLSRGSVVPRDP